LTGLQAAVLIAQFESLPEQIAIRERNAALLKDLLADTDRIVWQERPAEVTQTSNYLLPGRLLPGSVNRDEFCRRLSEAGIPCTPFYPFPLYRNPLYEQPGSCRVLPSPMAEAYVNDAFWLPHRLLLSDTDTIQEAAAVIRKILR
jgi:dTDP-4-amino-4,6-dideoxygalactose transaminase